MPQKSDFKKALNRSLYKKTYDVFTVGSLKQALYIL